MKNFQKKTTHFFKLIDIFGYRNELKIKGNSRYKTKLGGLLTAAMISLALVLFIYFGFDMFYRKNPNSFKSEIYERDPELIKFSKDNFFFMFSVEKIATYEHFYDPTIYNASMIQQIFNASGSYSIDIPLEPCTEDHLPSNSNLRDYFISTPRSNLKNLICVKKEKFSDLEIQGSYDGRTYTNVKIFIKTCVNSTANDFACKSTDIINSNLKGFFVFYTMDYIINAGDYESPAEASGKDYIGFIGPETTLMSNRYIATSEITTDDGWLMNDIKTKKYPTFADEKESLIGGNDALRAQFCIRKFHTKFVYERKYKKIQEVLAEICGILNIICLFFRMLAFPFAFKSYGTKLTNEVFNFEGGNEDKTKGDLAKFHSRNNPKYKKRITKILKSDLSNGTIVSQDKISNKNIIKNSEWKKRKIMDFFLKLKNKKLNIGWWKKFKSNFVNDEETEIRIKQNRKAMDLIKNKLNITYLLKKFVELDKLKMLILDKDQLNLFDYLPKPVILRNTKIEITHFPFSQNYKNTTDHSYIEEEDALVKSRRLFNSFHKINIKRKMNEIDEKLINFLDQDIKNILVEQEIIFMDKTNSLLPEDLVCSERKEDFNDKMKNYIT